MGGCCDKHYWKHDDSIVGAYEWKAPSCCGMCGPKVPGFYVLQEVTDPSWPQALPVFESQLPAAVTVVEETPPSKCCCCICEDHDTSEAAGILNTRWTDETNSRLLPLGFRVDAFKYVVYYYHGNGGGHQEHHLLIRIYKS
eukprot:TRINITY_DN16051_c0_g1_i1.p1 TRINITY_DN16051_c0_g1~~TRINITY_DN16051_c0_g1_i1.p1  ORF type:complete len:141 (-),score=19.28 TRINITY_DN16051_c0_g1_i1:116-538(-)